ncbi:hypothetical protein [Parageobacillus thermoglucosidasius]|uniref:hypothetical protein n=1 Tax=Parageobacillus thermoglucosidasius TaxID=1426 RepID=UPI0001D186DE|nr:hypothetical protein [Parageobacillus thermoglucosidasius]AEH49596.1 hypothetical protein Geoth_3783 [Parageobacillus thermoglucosidasius C56-YS93]MED4905008.1 hypothetical protein [Parageobacillus thermoglucosidasius]MED4913004.1 hypothetical protein [Parageobacillus thermoglucosidasius]MED4945509.1 hypothetical protein [Parageobacillus thermoglucosidasius]MED4981240.1 hypothetical protein [Parageobacillus thermoglucosidasius]
MGEFGVIAAGVLKNDWHKWTGDHGARTYKRWRTSHPGAVAAKLAAIFGCRKEGMGCFAATVLSLAALIVFLQRKDPPEAKRVANCICGCCLPAMMTIGLFAAPAAAHAVSACGGLSVNWEKTSR